MIHRPSADVHGDARAVGRFSERFLAAGFEEVATTRIDEPFRLPSVGAYMDFVRNSASPIRQVLAGLDDAAAGAAWAEMEDLLSAFNTPNGWVGPNELLLTAGRRAGASAPRTSR